MSALLKQLDKVSLLIKLGKYDEAIKLSLSLVLVSPKEAGIRYYLGWAHVAKGDIDEAESVLHQSLQLDAEYSASHCMLGMIMMERGKYKAAEKSILHAISLDPEHAQFYGKLAHLYSFMDRNADAVRYAKKGMAIDPTNEDCLCNLYDAYSALGKDKEANAVLTKSLETYPESKAVLTNLGTDLTNKGKNKEARKVFESILKIDSNYAPALNGLRKSSGLSNRLPALLTGDLSLKLMYGFFVILVAATWYLSLDPDFPFTVYHAVIVGLMQFFAIPGIAMAFGQLQEVIRNKRKTELYGMTGYVNAIFTILSLVFTVVLLFVFIQSVYAAQFNSYVALLMATGVLFQLVFGFRVNEYNLKKSLRRGIFFAIGFSASTTVLLYPSYQVATIAITLTILFIDVAAFRKKIFRRWSNQYY